MKNKGLKKTYLPFLLWFLLFHIVLGGALLLLHKFNPECSPKIITLTLLNLANLWFIGLMQMIRQTGRVYYFTGITYKEAQRATKTARAAFARKNYRLFLVLGQLFLLWTLVSLLFRLHPAWDVLIWSLAIIAAACRSATFKLGKNPKIDV